MLYSQSGPCLTGTQVHMFEMLYGYYFSNHLIKNQSCFIITFLNLCSLSSALFCYIYIIMLVFNERLIISTVLYTFLTL